MLTPFVDFELDKGFESFLKEFEELTEDISCGVGVIGPAAAYALVWEWGNTRQVRPGPKTVLGTNPDGKMIWLSAQAPFGYIRRNEPLYWDLIHEQWLEVNLNQSTKERLKSEIERKFCKPVAKQMADIIRDNAPEDSGELKSNIQPLDPGDELLDKDTDRWETMFLGE